MQNTQSLQLQFDAFRLDEADARLTRDGRPISLPPKAFAVLCTLARTPGQLVTKDALLDAVWGHQHVSESVLKTTISELRSALSDDAKQPRYIETASRRGYRFIGAVSVAQAAAAAAAQCAPNIASDVQSIPSSTMIGRRNALARMHSAWNQAQSGRRQVFFAAGEAGVGKSTLIDNFVSGLGPVNCAYGQCVEQFGAGEPYLPVLEALSALCRKDSALVPLMRAIAPTWLLQLPWLSSDAEREGLRRELAGSGGERMLRELGELLDRYTSQQALLLVTEDLHWSDHATVRLIDHIARRRSPARLLWLGSFRLAELISDDHPLKGLRHELRLHRLCDEIVLDSFSEQELADYIDARFPERHFSEAFVRRLHAHTDGLPLFVVNVIDDMVSQNSADAIPPDTPSAAWQVPENLAGVMEKQIARLPDDVRSMLEAASVCGMEFRPQTIADALERDAGWVAEQCDGLVRRQHWIRHVAVSGLPDGSLGAHYAFAHALYRHVFYQRIGAFTRAQLHRNVARSMERSRANGLAVTAAELASHYDLGHDAIAALRHYGAAVDHALSHFAQIEAVSLTEKALALVPQCGEDPARLGLELALNLKRGVACSQLFGMASPQASQAFERAQALCDLLPETPALGWALNGLGLVRFADGDYNAAHAIGARIHALAERHHDPGLQIAACNLIGMSLAPLGEHRKGCEWLERGVAICESLSTPLPHDRFFVDPGVSMRGFLGIHLLPLGLFDQARAHVQAGMARGRSLKHPMAEALSIRCAAVVEVRLEQPETVRTMAASIEKLANAHGIVQADGAWRLLAGWAMAQLGDFDGGHARILEGQAIMKRLGMITTDTQILCYCAEARIAAGRWSDAKSHVDEALELARRLGERARLPDLFLLQARIALGEGQPDAAREWLHESLEEAHAQDALGFELPALVGLCELGTVEPDDLHALQIACERLTEGFDTPLVRRARELIGKGKALSSARSGS